MLRLDNVLLKYNEAQSIRNTYEHIVKRLREEKLTFNNQLTALERTINSKNRDFDELMKLSADANRAREVAQSELLQARNAFEDRQTKRAADMKEREQVVKIRKQMLEKQERRDAKRKDVLDHKDKLKRNTNELLSHSDAMFLDEKSVKSQENKLNLYEETFNKIKHVTGVSSVDEIIMKIKDQKTTKETLESLVQQNILHIEKLKEEEDALSKDLEHKETMSNSSTISKKIMDEAEESHAVT
jgi:coiled-coil domain-containing protein 151